MSLRLHWPRRRGDTCESSKLIDEPAVASDFLEKPLGEIYGSKPLRWHGRHPAVCPLPDHTGLGAAHREIAPLTAPLVGKWERPWPYFRIEGWRRLAVILDVVLDLFLEVTAGPSREPNAGRCGSAHQIRKACRGCAARSHRLAPSCRAERQKTRRPSPSRCQLRL